MKKIDTWLDIQRFLSEAESVERGHLLVPHENEEFIRVELSALSEVRGARRILDTYYV